MLAQCDAYSTIYDATGAPAPGVLVTLQHVEDSLGNAILLEPQRTTTDASGQFHFTLPRNARAWLNARATTLYSCNGGTQMIVPDAATGAFIPTSEVTPPPVGFTVAPPLVYVGQMLSLPRASASQDGYLSAVDFNTFASFEGALPEGNDNDLQMKNGSLFAAAKLYQGVGASDALMLADADPRAPFPSHGFVATRSPLTANVAGSAFATGLRIMDVDDGAGNAQWFEMLPSYGAMNFFWQHTGTGQNSREFLFDNGRARITIYGAWRGNVDEGDAIWMALHDNDEFKNQIFLQGEHTTVGRPPGLYISVSQNAYQFHFDHDGLNLPNDPVLALHAATKQYVDTHAGSGGGAPAGSGTELQYRASATAFGAIAGSSIGLDTLGSGAQQINLGPILRIKSSGVGRSGLALDCTFSSTQFSLRDPNDAIPPVNVFYAIHAAGNPGIIYFGRQNGVYAEGARSLLFYTSPTGTTDLRRMFISQNGSVQIAQQTLADSTTALTVNAPGNGTFTRALFVNGIGEMSADPTTPLGIATKQFVEAHAGGAVDLAANYAWTGNHSFTQPLVATSLKMPAFTSGYVASVMDCSTDGNDTFSFGPDLTSAASATGRYVMIRCGTGNYNGAPGSVFIHGPLATWYIYAHLRPAAGYTFCIYDASTNSNPVMKIGPAGSGPGGTGRMIYVD